MCLPCALGLFGAVSGDVVCLLTYLASTWLTGLLALLGAVTDTVTVFATQHAVDLDTLDGDDFIWAVTLDVTELVAVATLGDTTIDSQTGISETLEVDFWRFWPHGEELGALRLLGHVEADSVRLADLTLEVDDGPCLFDCLLQADEVDFKVALAELLLQAEVCSGWDRLSKNLDAIAEVVEILLIRSLLQHGPCFGFGLVRDVGVVDGLGVLAFDSVVALLETLSADLGFLGTVTSLMT